MDPTAQTLEQAYGYCENLARTHYENFTVGSWFLPRDKRRHIYNLYAFCRTVDDLGDEAPGDRLKLLAEWEEDLRRCYEGTPCHPVHVALQETIRRHDLPMDSFLKLIEANRRDQTVTRYKTFQELLDYCDRSANPCGRLFLAVFGYRDEERQRLSDSTCTALQLTNFWQDIFRDWRKGRVYIPQEDLVRSGYTEQNIEDEVVNNAFRRLMKFEVQRTRKLFLHGLTVTNHIEGAVRRDVRLFSLGGMKVLEAIEKNGYDVYSRRPTLSKWGKIRLVLKAFL